MQQKWYQSWALWVSLAALVVYICKTIFGWDIDEWMDGFLNVLCPVLVAFGIINNPNTKGALGYKEPEISEEADDE